MTSCNRFANHLLTLLFLFTLLAVFGCEGTEKREKVDTMVEELAGKKDLERYNQMKENLDGIKNRQAEKWQPLEDDQEDR